MPTPLRRFPEAVRADLDAGETEAAEIADLLARRAGPMLDEARALLRDGMVDEAALVLADVETLIWRGAHGARQIAGRLGRLRKGR